LPCAYDQPGLGGASLVQWLDQDCSYTAVRLKAV